MIDEAKRERMREASRRYRLRHPERAKQSYKRWRDANKEQVAAIKRDWRLRNLEIRRAKEKEQKRQEYLRRKDVLLARHKAWCLANPEKKKASDKRIAERNKVRRSEQAKEWWAKHGNDPQVKLAHSQRGKENYAARKSEILKRHAAWRKANKGYWSAVQAKRRLVESSAVNLGQIKAWMKRIRSKSTAICYYCQRCVPISEIHFDHIVPLSKGGPHSIENLCVSCQPCNNSKHAHLVRTWVRVGQQVLEL